eukprot:364425-Chlamydomonas_euryale.AAC.11
MPPSPAFCSVSRLDVPPLVRTQLPHLQSCGVVQQLLCAMTSTSLGQPSKQHWSAQRQPQRHHDSHRWCCHHWCGQRYLPRYCRPVAAALGPFAAWEAAGGGQVPMGRGGGGGSASRRVQRCSLFKRGVLFASQGTRPPAPCWGAVSGSARGRAGAVVVVVWWRWALWVRGLAGRPRLLGEVVVEWWGWAFSACGLSGQPRLPGGCRPRRGSSMSPWDACGQQRPGVGGHLADGGGLWTLLPFPAKPAATPA